MVLRNEVFTEDGRPFWLFSEEKCREHFQKVRWPTKPSCPYCKTKNVWKSKRRVSWICSNAKCKKEFSLLSGTAFQDSRLSLSILYQLIWLMVSLNTKKPSINALQLQKELRLGSYKTAFLLHRRIRTLMTKTLKDSFDVLGGLYLNTGGERVPALIFCVYSNKGHLKSIRLIGGNIDQLEKLLEQRNYPSLMLFRNLKNNQDFLPTKVSQDLANEIKSWLLGGFNQSIESGQLQSYLDYFSFLYSFRLFKVDNRLKALLRVAVDR